MRVEIIPNYCYKECNRSEQQQKISYQQNFEEEDYLEFLPEELVARKGVSDCN